MRRTPLFVAGLLVLLALAVAPVAMAQVTGLYYKEVEKDGRVYVFNTPERYLSWSQSGDMGTAVTLPGRGPNGETVVGENETAIDLYLFKHNLDAYDRPTPKPKPPGSPFPGIKFNVRVYADVTDKENKDKGSGLKSGDSGVGVDVKRFYFTATHEFDQVWSAQFQSDIGDQGARRYDVFVKKAFIQAKFSPEATFRLGSADTAWIPFVEGLYGYRYVEQTITDHLSFGSSADWGLHFLGKAGDIVSYYISAENGRGFSNPARSKNVDFEGRISVEPIKGLNFAVGGYSGKRGLETDAAKAKNTATRTDALVAYTSDRFRFGGEWFEAKDWNQVTTVREDKADGYSVWGSVGLTDTFTIFGRFDEAKPSKEINPKLKFNYYNAGLQLRVNKAFAGSLVYKYAQVENGTLGTGNGTIGSTKLAVNNKGEYNEIGVFAVYDF